MARTAPRLHVPARIACDVHNPLLGPKGPAAVYGPQKGLSPDDVTRLDAAAARVGLGFCAKPPARISRSA